jgi:hypothetical protein
LPVLPQAHLVVIDRRKIIDYLLSRTHPGGRSKAEFFRRFGFRAESWQTLSGALLEHARSAEVVSRIETEFGTKYTVQAVLAAAGGRTPRVWSVWFVAIGETAPRLVTAFSASGERA